MPQSTIVLEQAPRQRLTRVVAEQLLDTIHRQGLSPGTRLPSEHELMRMLHVGRSTVREALNGLAIAGVVEIRHGQGCFVASTQEPPPAALETAVRSGVTSDLMEARLLVEVEMLGLAAARATPEDLGRAEDALRAYEQAVRSGSSTVKLASRLHMRLLEAAHNEVLLGFVRVYAPKVLERGHELEARGPRQPWEEYEEHAKLFAAVLDHDPARARDCMRQHLGAMEVEITRVEKPWSGGGHGPVLDPTAVRALALSGGSTASPNADPGAPWEGGPAAALRGTPATPAETESGLSPAGRTDGAGDRAH